MPTPAPKPSPTRSCDACRIAKVRCIPRRRPSPSPDGTQKASAASTVCDRCAGNGSTCSFSLPLKRRGPKPKQERPESSAFSTFNIAEWNNIVLSPDAGSSKPSPAPAQTPLPSVEGRTGINDGSYNASSPSGPSITVTPSIGPPLGAMQRWPWPLSSDCLCSRRTFDLMMQDFLDMQYPVMPVIHRPSFKRDLMARRETNDPVFFTLVITIAAALVANIPSCFYKYRAMDSSFPYQTRTQMINLCYEMAMHLRAPEYFDHSTHEKWAIAYLLGVAHGNLHHRSRSLMYSAEADHHIRQLQYQQQKRRSESKIELQMHCKAVCLGSNGYFHRVSIEPCEPSVLSEMQMPILSQWKDGLLEVDDENILEDRVLPQPKHRTTLATGLKALTRLYEIASETMRLGHAIESERALGSLNPTTANTRSPSDRQKILDRLREGFERQKHALDNMPPEFDEWTSTGNNTGHRLNGGDQPDPVTARQFEILRANIRVTHLWLQSVIFEDIVSLATDGIINVKDNNNRTPGAQAQEPSDITLRGLWDDRENICRQLLQVLYNISHENLEPNGASLVHKIRVVAATLIDCPFELQGSIARQAHSYIQAFANVLSTLDPADDGAYARDLWTNLDQHKRLSVSDFAYSPR